MSEKLLEQEQPRYFNKIEVVSEYKIKKTSEDKHKMLAEYSWLKGESKTPSLPSDTYTSPTKYIETPCRIYTPNVYNYIETDSSASYTMDYIHGATLRYFYLEGCLDTSSFYTMIDSLYLLISSQREIPVNDYTKMNIHSMYSDKTIARLKETNIDLDKEYIINDHHTPSINEIIKNCPVGINNSDIRLVHGDLCLSNIMLCNALSRHTSPGLGLIDPRGYLPDGTITKIGDIKYDVAKLAHSFIGRYDQIKAGKFICNQYGENKYTWSCESTEQQSALEKYFIDTFKEYDYFNIMIHLFLSMIPLHKDNPVHQERMLVNALRLYLQKDNKF